MSIQAGTQVTTAFSRPFNYNNTDGAPYDWQIDLDENANEIIITNLGYVDPGRPDLVVGRQFRFPYYLSGLTDAQLGPLVDQLMFIVTGVVPA